MGSELNVEDPTRNEKSREFDGAWSGATGASGVE